MRVERNMSFKPDVDVDIWNMWVSRIYVSAGQNDATCASSATDMKILLQGARSPGRAPHIDILEGLLARLDVPDFDPAAASISQPTGTDNRGAPRQETGDRTV